MVTTLKLYDGRKVRVEQTMTKITAHFEGESAPRNITSAQYMNIVLQGTPIDRIS